MTDVKKTKDEDTEDSEDRDKRRPRYEDKGSTTDAKGLKPDVLDTSMPQLTIKNWFTCWDNYKHASGWGQGENHKTQMAYLRMCLSEEIRTAVDFDDIRTMDKAIFDIRAYMTSSVMPLTLQRLDLFRYSPPQGQSQSATTQTVVELFRNCEGFSITPEEVLIICLLNTIQEMRVLVKVQEAIDAKDNLGKCPEPHCQDRQHFPYIRGIQAGKNQSLRCNSRNQSMLRLWLQGIYGRCLHCAQDTVKMQIL